MTVADLLRQARAKSVQATDAAAHASGVVANFLANYSFEDCNPQQLLTLADLAMRGGHQDAARAALDRAIQADHNIHLAHYKRGRLELAQNDLDAAAQHFRAGRIAEPSFPYNWMGEARVLHALGRKDEALPCAERFAGFGVRPHANSELTILADLGDHLFDAGDRRRSLPLYDIVVRFGADRPRDAVRLAEAMIVAGDHTGARRILAAQDERGRLDEWGRRALALASSLLGEHAAAIAAAEAVLQQNPYNAGFVTTFLDVLVRSGDTDRMRDALARHGGMLPSDAVCELTARLKIAAGDINGAMADLAPAEIAYQSRLYYLSFETAYGALEAGAAESAMALGARLGEIAPADIFVKLLRIDIFFRQQMWEQAASVLALMTDEENDRPHVMLKRFEYSCFIGDWSAALALSTRLEAVEAPDKQFMLPVFRFLAERKSWDELIDRAIIWLDPQFNYAQIGYVLFRAAKHTGRQAAVITAIEAIGDWQSRPDLVQLRANLACDAAETLPVIEKLARDPTIARDPVFRHRLEVKRDILARAMATGHRRAVFFCTDRSYLCATIVALHSAARAVDPRGVDFFVVTDDDLVDLCRNIIEPFTHTGLMIRVVPASDVVDAAEKLHSSYGLFTSGHMLASAAYYRIYFAKYLHRLGGYERAVYMDSDIIVRSRLERLFLDDLHGRPLGARLESMRPEVRRAISLHGLTDNRYFNSGVLLLDLKNDRLQAALDGAISAIMDDEVTLLYHDQCALNLGFRADFTDLSNLYNFPVNEATKLDDVPDDAVILHFLDRPKPWSAAYGGQASVLWFDCWRETAAVIGESIAVELFAQISE